MQVVEASSLRSPINEVVDSEPAQSALAFWNSRFVYFPCFTCFQSPNQWFRVLMNQNPSIANHTSAKMPASLISRPVSGAPEAMRRTRSSRLPEPGAEFARSCEL
jgi:hypothetical protein